MKLSDSILFKGHFQPFPRKAFSGIFEEVIMNAVEQHFPKWALQNVKEGSGHLLPGHALKPFLLLVATPWSAFEEPSLPPHRWSTWYGCDWVSRCAQGPGPFSQHILSHLSWELVQGWPCDQRWSSKIHSGPFLELLGEVPFSLGLLKGESVSSVLMVIFLPCGKHLLECGQHKGM